ncbi:neurogenic locus notch -like protein [Brachionus plicatilis]|uniref:Neurogenic locus notch-like protein n=1 Tax=Brachionus plicatilis TaxID=10195 RepID=A0A3M7RXS2_BRAPC|nr:neurogenic locus notch -like protein [Brachionus plicatilis]
MSVVKRESNPFLCSPSTCLNGGVCVRPDPDLYITYCNCAEGFTGVLCEIPTKCIFNKTCKNNGYCLTTDAGAIVCNCPLPYTGTYCQINNKFCDLKPCKNGGICKQTGEYDGKCECPSGYEGRTCNTKKCDSNNNPCNEKNTLACLQIDDQFRCLCQTGFTGENCESEL